MAATLTRTADDIDREALLAAAPGVEVAFRGDSADYRAARVKGSYLHADFPSAVAKPSTPEEVALLLKFAKEHQIKISILGGGHSSLSMKGQLVISMRKMSTVVVDPEAMTVKIGGGCLIKQVDEACAPHGIACVLGNAYTVGAAGLVSGGGYGHLARWKGLAIDHMLAATLVLADGSVVECSAGSAEHADLFWALRGGGAQFGVLVSFTLRAIKIGWDDAKGKGRIYGGMRIIRNGKGFPFGNGVGNSVELLKRWRDYCLRAPNEVSAATIMPFGAPIMVQEYNFKGELAAAKEEAKQWKANGRAIVSMLKMRSYYSDIQQFVGKMEDKEAKKGGVPGRLLNTIVRAVRIERMSFLPSCCSLLADHQVDRFLCSQAAKLPDEAIEVLAHAASKGAPKGIGQGAFIIFPLGGKIARPDEGEEATAFSQRDAAFWIVCSATYAKAGKEPTPKQEQTLDAWLEDLAAKLNPLVLSPTVGAICRGAPFKAGMGFKQAAGGSVFSEAKMTKLLAVKGKYDPDNVFFAVENGMSNAHSVHASSV